MSEKSTNGNGEKWRFAFWIITVGSGIVVGLLSKGYFVLDSKIAAAEERMKEEKKDDVAKIEKQIDKVDDKVDDIKQEQKVMRQEFNDKFTKILVQLEQIKRNQ